jgi:hypothetical protein
LSPLHSLPLLISVLIFSNKQLGFLSFPYQAYFYAAKILNFVRKQAESMFFFSDSAVLRAFPCMILQQLFHGKGKE